jgi:hypothetical protein
MAIRTESTLDKAKRYGWSIPDNPGKLEWLDKNKILIQSAYQREAIPSKIKEITSNFTWISFGVLVVALRDGQYWAIDGQNRLEAAKRRREFEKVPCIVFETSGLKEEAKAFLGTNTLRKPVTARGKFNASIVCEDEIAMHVHNTLKALGIVVKETANTASDFKAIALALKLAKEDRDRFDTVMMVAADLCPDMVIQATLIDGLFYIDKRLTGGITQKRFHNRLKSIGVKKLLEAANKAATFFIHRGAKEFAFGMMEEINRGLRTKFELTEGK